MPKREKYNLQRLLETRTRERDDAVKTLAESRRKLAAAEAELTERKSAVENCRRAQSDAQTAMLEKSSGGIKNSEMLYHRQHLIDLRETETELVRQVEQQKSVVARREQEVETALAELKEASKELRVIEKHKENWQNEKRIEATRREQKSNDEIGAILHERSKIE